MKFITRIESKLGRQFLVLVVSGLIVSTAFAQELESASIGVIMGANLMLPAVISSKET
jgi:hypothetical protein